jgi:hypothetical protein
MEKEYTHQIIKRIINGETGINIQTEKESTSQYYQFNGADILSIRAMVNPSPKICPILTLNCLEAFRQLGFIDGDPVKEHDQDRIDMLKDAIEYLSTTSYKETVIANMQNWLMEMQNIS